MNNILLMLNTISEWLLGGQYFYSFSDTIDFLTGYTVISDGGLLGNISGVFGYIVANAEFIPSLIAWSFLLGIVFNIAILIPYKLIRRAFRSVANVRM